MSEELYIGKPDEPWVDFTEDFDYDKVFYDVLLPNGEIVKQCWPNAGYMNGINGDGRKWSDRDGVKVRPSMEHPEYEGKTLIVDDREEVAREFVREASRGRPNSMSTLALAAAAIGDFGYISNFTDSIIPRGRPGTPIGCHAEDGKPFKDSRGQTFIRVKGTIRRWKGDNDGSKIDKPTGTAGPEETV